MQQRLPRRGIVRTGAHRSLQGKAIERSAQRLAVCERARTNRTRARSPASSTYAPGARRRLREQPQRSGAADGGPRGRRAGARPHPADDREALIARACGKGAWASASRRCGSASGSRRGTRRSSPRVYVVAEMARRWLLQDGVYRPLGVTMTWARGGTFSAQERSRSSDLR